MTPSSVKNSNYLFIALFVISLCCVDSTLSLVSGNSTISDDASEVCEPSVDSSPDMPRAVYEDDESDYFDEDEYEEEDITEPEHATPVKIRAIIVEGNARVPNEAILNKIPYHVGEIFDPLKSNKLIKNLYELDYFNNVQLFTKKVDAECIDLYIRLSENKALQEVIFKGNKHLSEEEIRKKIDFEIPTIDQHELERFSAAIKRMYREKNYHNVDITPELIIDGERATAKFTIKENQKTFVKRVFFAGNETFSDKQLRKLLFTREDWILGFMDRAGMYMPEAIEGDRQILENFYQSHGFLNGKVTDVTVDTDPETKSVDVTFHIDEGDLYTISEVSAPGNEDVSEEYLLARLPIKPGDLYSRDAIRQAIETLRLIWGEYGYIYADIEPSVQPDENNKTVALGFFTELGEKVYLNRINIIGNQKTRDKVIRRKLFLQEGDLLTTKKMEESKYAVESLGYFEQQAGVSWKINRTKVGEADLDLMVHEVKTGNVNVQIGFGGNPKDFANPTESFNIGGSVSDSNLLGLGIACDLSGQFSKQERQFLFNITQPWLFDRPISAAFDAQFKNSSYDDLKATKDGVQEELANASVSLGFVAQRFNNTSFIFQGGFEGLHYKNRPEASNKFSDEKVQLEYQAILDRRFLGGNFFWLGTNIGIDCRNHPAHPSRGYQWSFANRYAIPFTAEKLDLKKNNGLGFVRADFDASWYTPIIGERDLVFGLHAHVGMVGAFNNKTIPYRELYHIGGPATVRGFLYGQIGPTWNGDSIGGKKAFWLNAELFFPLMPDFSIKGVLFYDGGSGWDTPDASMISKRRLMNNKFDYRHAVGFGFRVYQPTPVRVDWGFKLDRRKGEPASEVHFAMSRDF